MADLAREPPSAPVRHAPSPSSASAAGSVPNRQRSRLAPASAIKTVVTAPPWARDEPPSPTASTHADDTLLSPSLSRARSPSDATASSRGGTLRRPSDASSSAHPPASATSWSAFVQQRPGQGQGGTTSAPTAPGRGNGGAASPAPEVDDDGEDGVSPSADVRTPTQRFRSLGLNARSISWLSGSPAGSARTPGGGIALTRPPPAATAGSSSTSNAAAAAVLDAPPRGRRTFRRPDMADRGLTITLPAPNPFTAHQSQTPGWQSPWTPRAEPPASSADGTAANGTGPYSHLDGEPGSAENGTASANTLASRTTWGRRKKQARQFLLNNVYVPLLFRVINISFTSAALAVAVRIREVEAQYHILGAVGSSPTLVIIFAPLTLIHVLGSIYLEYFGRPLGLWRTSHKLAHTLFEVLFICAWSAALSLTFDNFFTSYVPCAPLRSISWYNELPRPDSPISDVDLGRGEGGPGDRICDDQLVLIGLVFIGLIMYCTNLVISLYRIFEKVKYHKQGWSAA